MIETWHPDTKPEVKSILQQAQNSRMRIRLFLGNTKTGLAWAEEYDVTGYVGNTTGNKSPILLYNERAMGGGIMTEHIVAIVDLHTKRFLYKHPTFSTGTWEVKPSTHLGYVESVHHNGKEHANFKNKGDGQKYIAFMKGERMKK